MVGEKLFAPAGLIVFLMGVAMMLNTNWGWGQVLDRRRPDRLRRDVRHRHRRALPAREEDHGLRRGQRPDAPETMALIKRILLIVRFDIAMLLLVIADMVTKPFQLALSRGTTPRVREALQFEGEDTAAPLARPGGTHYASTMLTATARGTNSVSQTSSRRIASSRRTHSRICFEPMLLDHPFQLTLVEECGGRPRISEQVLGHRAFELGVEPTADARVEESDLRLVDNPVWDEAARGALQDVLRRAPTAPSGSSVSARTARRACGREKGRAARESGPSRCGRSTEACRREAPVGHRCAVSSASGRGWPCSARAHPPRGAGPPARQLPQGVLCTAVPRSHRRRASSSPAADPLPMRRRPIAPVDLLAGPGFRARAR